MPNPVVQFQIISKDPDSTSRFYADLFEWTVNARNAMGYRQISTGASEGIQGGIWPAPPQSPNFVQLLVAVENVADSVKKAEALGAKLLVPPTVLPEGDEMAVLHDPQGMPFGIWRRA